MKMIFAPREIFEEFAERKGTQKFQANKHF